MSTDAQPQDQPQEDRTPLVEQLRLLAPSVRGSGVNAAEVPQILGALVHSLDATGHNVADHLFERPVVQEAQPTADQERLARIEDALAQLLGERACQSAPPSSPDASAAAVPANQSGAAPGQPQAEFHGTVEPVQGGDPA